LTDGFNATGSPQKVRGGRNGIGQGLPASGYFPSPEHLNVGVMGHQMRVSIERRQHALHAILFTNDDRMLLLPATPAASVPTLHRRSCESNECNATGEAKL